MKHSVRPSLLILVVLCAFAHSAVAQSTVTLYVANFNNTTTTLYVDGDSVCSMNSPIKNTIACQDCVADVITYNPTVRRLQFNTEGRVTLRLEAHCTVATTGETSTMNAETTLDLTDGSVHVLKVGYKGLNEIRFTTLSKKQAAKEAKKNYHHLPDYVRP